MAWSPETYLKFADHRLRPALDLLNRIDLDDPKVIYDLGCGPGNVTEFLAKRWPTAAVTGFDNSPEMLQRAGEDFPHMSWRLADIGHWRAPEPADLIYSNAALHWLDGHDKLFSALFAAVAPGGVLAVQMPRNFAQPSHLLMRECAEAGPWASVLRPLLRADPVASPAEYWRILSPEGAELDIWEVDYLQRLTGEDAVFNWMMGTTLRPLLAALTDELRGDYLASYRRALGAAYTPEKDGSTLFPFRRLFLVARKSIL